MNDDFEFIAGSLALCFVDTLGGRGGMPIERLPTAERFTDWLTAANLTALGAIAGDDELSGARRLRSAITRAVAAIVGGGHPATDDADCINAFAAAPPLRPQLVARGMIWTAERPVAAALSAIAADAIATLQQSDRLRECDGCKMYFLDNTRGRRRRWCSSASGCGNRAKVRRHRDRKAVSHAPICTQPTMPTEFRSKDA